MNTSMQEGENKGPFPKIQERVVAACGIGTQTIPETLQESRLVIKKCGSTSFVSRSIAKRTETELAYVLIISDPSPLQNKNNLR
jgi:hypothetical protein